MPKNIKKSVRDYLYKIKTSRSQIQLPSKKWILSGCKHPRTPSFTINNKKNNNKDDEATLADIDRFLLENFKSLYLEDHEETDSDRHIKRIISERQNRDDPPKLPIFDSSRRFEEPPQDLFMETTTTEGGSSSVISINDSSENEGLEDQTAISNNCVVVLACSPNPYEDFRRSMEGMVEAKLRNREKVDWDFMQELLFCLMELNQKKSHKFILSAFVDLMSNMKRKHETVPAKPKPRSVRTVRIGREVRKKTREVFEFESL